MCCPLVKYTKYGILNLYVLKYYGTYVRILRRQPAKLKGDKDMATNKKVTADEVKKVAATAKKAAAEAVTEAKTAVNEAKTTVTAETKKAAEETKKVAEKVKTTAKKATETVAEETKKVTAKKTAEKKPAAKKAEPVRTAVLQFAGDEYKVDEIIAKAEAAFKAEKKRTAIKDIKVYIKPEEKAAYYVVNNDYAGRVDL